MTRNREERLTDAVAAVTAGASQRWAAKHHNVSRRTLERRLQGKPTHAESRQALKVLTPTEEASIVSWTLCQTRLGFGLKHSVFRLYAQRILRANGVYATASDAMLLD
ncbi:hypothetical protein PG994_008854 [Apiospora phragmitis]|uniref:HTH psq-type domain-containing protein n=1 Tax=Apiospora phragmitis TaxID=2905665 RepID=A0ABR1UHN1_9PEZI